MKEESQKLLEDIRVSINLIDSFLDGISAFSDYQKDMKTKSAVERQLGIIGEAINKLLKIEPQLKLSAVNEIIGLRNRIIHAYDSIDDSIIWIVAKSHLAELKKEVTNLLK